MVSATYKSRPRKLNQITFENHKQLVPDCIWRRRKNPCSIIFRSQVSMASPASEALPRGLDVTSTALGPQQPYFGYYFFFF